MNDKGIKNKFIISIFVRKQIKRFEMGKQEDNASGHFSIYSYSILLSVCNKTNQTSKQTRNIKKLIDQTIITLPTCIY